MPTPIASTYSITDGSTTSSVLESLWSMPKPLETSAKLHDVSVSQEILSIGHLDKKSRDDLQVRALPMHCCKITIARRRRPELAQPLDRSRPAF
jgi:hypothetical protein